MTPEMRAALIELRDAPALDLRLRLALIHLDAEAAPQADPVLPVAENTGVLFSEVNRG